jgi:hypothetical protein
MNNDEGNVDDRELARALRRLNETVVVPAADPARTAALMAAFDAAQGERGGQRSGRQYWFMGALATAAAILMAFSSTLHRPQPMPQPPNEFVMVPGAAGLPAMESGSLVRMEVPVSMLPSLGLTPPQTGSATSVQADLIVGQDGLTRAARLVNQ